MRLSLAFVLTCAVAGFSLPAMAGQCMTMVYKDPVGAIVPTENPIIAFMLAGTPITGPVDLPPAAASRDLGAPVECPKELITKIENLFADSCLSEKNRQKTMADNKVDAATVNKRCADMGEALHPANKQ